MKALCKILMAITRAFFRLFYDLEIKGRAGHTVPAKQGAAFLAMKSGAPVVPVTLAGAFHFRPPETPPAETVAPHRDVPQAHPNERGGRRAAGPR